MSLSARLNYLGFDRPDLQFAVKELMRRMTNPTVSDFIALKRVVRYLITAPRYAMTVPWQSMPDRIRVYVDANWAGCVRTRNSTLGGIVCFGHMPVKSYSKTMSIIALSSGESELAAIIKGAGEGLGFQSSLRDFELAIPLELYSDATAAIGMCKREGLGRVRHLSTADLWIQQLIRHDRIRLFKCPSIENPSDMCTKGLGRDRIVSLMQMVYYQLQGGRSPLAPVRNNVTPLLSPAAYDPDPDTGPDCAAPSPPATDLCIEPDSAPGKSGS